MIVFYTLDTRQCVLQAGIRLTIVIGINSDLEVDMILLFQPDTVYRDNLINYQIIRGTLIYQISPDI